MITAFHKEVSELIQVTELALKKIMEVNMNIFDRETTKAEAHLAEYTRKIKEISKYVAKLQTDINLATEEKEFNRE